MIDLGLTTTERTAFHRTLAQTHEVGLTVRIRDRMEAVLGTLTADVSDVLSGQVDMSFDTDIRRRLSLRLLDPTGRVALDPDSPSESALWPSQFIEVISRHRVYSTDTDLGYSRAAPLDRWVEVPVFYGALTRYRREGAEVEIEGLGKESQSLAPWTVWTPQTIPDGTLVSVAIRRILGRASNWGGPAGAGQGEGRFRLGEISARVGRVSIARGDQAWMRARAIANNHGYQLFYDGAGYVRMRRAPMSPLFTFRMAPLGGYSGGLNPPVVSSPPSITYDFDGLYNGVHVQGPIPKHGKDRIAETAWPGADHPLSPSAMARKPGLGRYAVEVITNEALKSSDAAKQQATNRLNEHLASAASCRFECLPVPHLEENDLVTLAGIPGAPDVTFRLREFTLPLTTRDKMMVGDTRRIPVPRERR